MPDYPPIDALKAAVERRILPVKAGDASPIAMRAQEALRKVFPADMVGVNVREMPMTNPRAFSDVLGSVSIGPIQLSTGRTFGTGDPAQIDLNPALTAGFPEHAVEGVIAHELEHVRQGRTRDPLSRMKEFALPYAKRPDELAASTAERTYLSHMPTIGHLPDEDMVISALGDLFKKR